MLNNPMQQPPPQPMLPHQMPQLHHHQPPHLQHQQPLADHIGPHPGTIMDPSQIQRVAGSSSMHLPKHLQHMSAAGPVAGPGACMDMVDWRTGPGAAAAAGSAGPVDLESGIQQYRHGPASAPVGMYPHPQMVAGAAPGPPGAAMNGLLHHSQQPVVRRLPGPQSAAVGPGYSSSCTGPAYPGSMGPQYGGVPAGAGGKAMAAGPMGMGPEYGRTLSNGFIPNDADMLPPGSTPHGGAMTRPMTSLPVRVQQPSPMGQHYSQQPQMYYQPYGPSSHPQPISRTSSDMVPNPSGVGQQHAAAVPPVPLSTTAATNHDRPTVSDVATIGNRKTKEKMTASSVSADMTGSACSAAGMMPSQASGHRAAPYPTPQQYMLNKRAKYSSNSVGGATVNTEMAASFPGGAMSPRFDSTPRPLRHLAPGSDFPAMAGPRLSNPGFPQGTVAPGAMVGMPSQGQPFGPGGQRMFNGSPPGYAQQPQSQPNEPSPGCQGLKFNGPKQNYQLSPLPGNPTPPITPGALGGSQSIYYQQSPPVGTGGDQKPQFPPGPGDVGVDPAAMMSGMPPSRLEHAGVGGPDAAEPRLVFVARDGLIMAPFRLEHNLAVSNIMFAIRGSLYQHIMSRFDVDVQLKCFHHEDQLMKTNWPASVSVSVNNMPLAIDRGDGRNQRPVFLKRVIQPGHNMLQIAVSNCCCSHLFIIQLVHRPTVKSAIQMILSQRLVMADQSIMKIKRSLSQRNAVMPGSVGEDVMKISLVCNMSRRRILLPARGIDCTHIQCFDLEAYLRINSECNAWVCPICNKPALFDGLEVDQYVWSILQQLARTQFVEVTVDQTASWKPVPMNGLVTPDTVGGQWSKPISPESVVMPTVNTWIAQFAGATQMHSSPLGGPAGTMNAPCGNGGGGQARSAHYNGSTVWCPPPSVGSPPDYIGCLSQMSDAFLSNSTPTQSHDETSAMQQQQQQQQHHQHQQQQQQQQAVPMGTMATPSTTMAVTATSNNNNNNNGLMRQHSDNATSLPPTPVSSQLSTASSQICTPLDGQSLHPRTPSDMAAPASAPSAHLPHTPLDGGTLLGSSSSSSQKSPTTTALGSVGSKGRESCSGVGGAVPMDGGSISDADLSCGETATIAGDSGIGASVGCGSNRAPSDQSGIDPADQDALDMLPDNLDDPMELLTYLGPDGGQSVTDGLDTSILSMFS